jgi:hypothetical protein
MAERGSKRLRKPLQRAGAAADHHAAVRGRPGPHPAVRPRRHRQPAARSGFGIEPSRWFYGWFGVWLAQTFAFTPIAFMIMRGVVQGVSPSLEEAAQTLRADRRRTFFTVTLPLLKPGLANAFLVGFIESMADFGNPVVVGGQFSVLSTDIFFAIVGAQYDQGRAASLAWVLTLFALGVFALQRGLLGKQNYTTVAARATRASPMALPDGVRRLITASRCRGSRSRWWSTCSPSPAASCRPGAATTRFDAGALQDRVRAGVGRSSGWCGRARRGTRSSPRSSWRPSRRRSPRGWAC